METDILEQNPTIPIGKDASLAANHRFTGKIGNQLKNWLGLLPFLIFSLLFEVLPAAMIVQGSFTDTLSNAATLNNYRAMFSQWGYVHAFQTSISLALITALTGAILGFMAAYGISTLRASWLRNVLMGFSSIAANFAGVPLAFAFIATLGATGFITVNLQKLFGFSLYSHHFSLYTFWGLVIVYTYFQIPLMVIVTLPALNGLRKEWREAAINLGATNFTYWWRVALPILLPSMLAATILLFANAFAAYATAYALAQGAINLVPILIGFVINGNVSMDPGLVDALAVGMIIILLVTTSIYLMLVRRASIWTGK